MFDDITFEKAKVYLNNLSPEMTILSYIGFTKKYHDLNRHTCAYLKHHFHGADAIVVRDNRRYLIPIEFIEERDFLFRIENFPASLNRLTQVTDRLKQSLRSQGMLRFEVMRSVPLSMDSHQDLMFLLDLVNPQTNSLI